MAKSTPIQWCDSTVNPVMGCEGCELWPSNRVLKQHMGESLAVLFPQLSLRAISKVVDDVLGKSSASEIWENRGDVVQIIVTLLEDLTYEK
jgi:hypothetical protein